VEEQVEAEVEYCDKANVVETKTKKHGREEVRKSKSGRSVEVVGDLEPKEKKSKESPMRSKIVVESLEVLLLEAAKSEKEGSASNTSERESERSEVGEGARRDHFR
jgi:hypothetical protein